MRLIWFYVSSAGCFLALDSWAVSSSGWGLDLSRPRVSGVSYTSRKHCKNKKAELSQRRPRDAPYVWVPWKFSGVPDYAHGYFSQNLYWAFVPIEPINVHAKFEIRSFSRSWDNTGYPKKLGSCSIFSNRKSYRSYQYSAIPKFILIVPT